MHKDLTTKPFRDRSENISKVKIPPGYKKKAIKRYVPKLALKKLHSILAKERISFYEEKEGFYFILDLLHRLPTYNKDLRYKQDGYIQICSCYLKKYIRDYSQYLGALLYYNIIQTDSKYSMRDHICKGYRLNPELNSPLYTVEINPETKIWKAITENFNSKSHKKIPEHLKKLKENIMKIDFDERGAITYLTTLLDQGKISYDLYNSRVISVYRLAEKDINFNRNTTNWRVDTNLTNLKRELKNFIKGEYTQIDLSNSQPYLFNYVLQYYTSPLLSSCCSNNCIKPLLPSIERLCSTLKNPPNLAQIEVEHYRTLTREGRIYDIFVERFQMSRDEAKKLFLAVLYSSNRSVKYKEAKKAFKAIFPTIYQLIYKLKSSGHKLLPITLQKLEAEIFIDNIAKLITEENITIYTVHDSIIVPENEIDRVIPLIHRVFHYHFNEIPNFKDEMLTPKNLN